MSNLFVDYHKDRVLSFNTPQGEKIEFLLDTNRLVMDDFVKQYYFNVVIQEREKYLKLTDKMIEHYVYDYFKHYLKLFQIEGEIYLKFNYL